MNNDQIKPKQPITIDSETSSTPRINEKKKKLTQLFGIEAGIIGVIMIVLILILNYFGIVPLSTKFSSILGWLPHQSKPITNYSLTQQGQGDQEKQVPNQNTAPQTEKYLITCPVSPGFCPEGKQVYNKNTRTIEALGYITLGPELAIYAVFDGTIDSKTERRDGGINQTSIKLTGDNGFVATYTFHGLPRREKGATGTKVRQNEIIGVTEGGQLTLFDFTAQQYALGLSVVNTQNNQDISLLPRQDGKALDLQ